MTQSDKSRAGVLITLLAVIAGTGVLAAFSSSIYARNQKLEWQKAPFLEAANANAAAIIALDERGKIQIWNEGATRLFGWTESEMLGRGMERLADHREGSMHDDSFRESMKSSSPRMREVTCVAKKKDGESFEIHMIVMTSPPRGAVAVILDEDKVTRTVVSR